MLRLDDDAYRRVREAAARCYHCITTYATTVVVTHAYSGTDLRALDVAEVRVGNHLIVRRGDHPEGMLARVQKLCAKSWQVSLWSTKYGGAWLHYCYAEHRDGMRFARRSEIEAAPPCPPQTWTG